MTCDICFRPVAKMPRGRPPKRHPQCRQFAAVRRRVRFLETLLAKAKRQLEEVRL